VKSIAEMGAYVSLLEYNNIEGMILLSELSRRRIRSVTKLIKVRPGAWQLGGAPVGEDRAAPGGVGGALHLCSAEPPLDNQRPHPRLAASSR
jgi:hypothetical protein